MSIQFQKKPFLIKGELFYLIEGTDSNEKQVKILIEPPIVTHPSVKLYCIWQHVFTQLQIIDNLF